MIHVCHAIGCNVQVRPQLLMCLKHWRLIPRDLQRAVWAAYVPGQEIRKDPTDEYLDVQRAAVEAVARKVDGMTQHEGMEIDIRKHKHVRADVAAGIAALRVQGRQIWGSTRHTLPEIVLRLTIVAGDLARLARDGEAALDVGEYTRSLKKELGNILLSTIRWIDDLGLDPLECLDRAIEAQERFTKSRRPR